jgi:hypothetical protein
MDDDTKWDGTISIASTSDTCGGLDYSNTMSDVTYSFDTSTTMAHPTTITIPGATVGATVGGITGGAYTFDVGDHTIDLNTLDEDEIAEMCKEYPALKIVWQNFKTMYDLVKQDYKGKKLAGELDDDLLI